MSDTFETVRLGEVAEISMGQSPDSQHVEEGLDNGMPFLQGNAEFGKRYPNPRFSCSQPAKAAREGDVLVSVRAPVGEVNFANRSYCIGRGLSAVRFGTVPTSLGERLIAHFGAALKRVAQGTTFEAVGRNELSSLLLLLPPSDEQPIINRILDTLDTQIRRTEEIIAKLEQVKQGLLTDLLTRGIDENGELRPPPHQARHLYNDSPLGQIPKTWKIRFLDELAQRGSGHTPSKSVPAYWNGGVKWVSLSDSNRLDDVFIFKTDKEISELGLANSSAEIHPAGTVVLSRDAGIGRSAILASEMAVSQHFISWRCRQNLDNLFLYFWLQRMKPRFEAIALGSTIQTIGLGYFRNLKLAIPNPSEQKLIGSQLLQIQKSIWEYRKSLTKMKEQKIGLMDDLLIGRVRVTPLLDETDKAAD